MAKARNKARADLGPLLQNALAAHNAGDLQAAERAYRQLLAYDPRQPDGLHLLAACLLRQGRAAEALPYAGHALAAMPAVPAFHATQGEILRLLGRPEAAAAAFQKALTLDPRQVDALNGLAMVHDAANAGEAAAELYRQVFALTGLLPAAINHGRCLLKAGRPGEAAEALAALVPRLAEQPLDDEVFRGLTLALVECKRKREALACTQAWVQAHPASVWGRLYQASAYSALHREAEALPLLEALLREGVGGAFPLNVMGACYHRSGRPAEALAYYERALQFEPDNRWVRYNRCALLCEEGRLAEGMADYERLLAEHPDDPDLAFNHAQQLLLLGDFARGWPAYEGRARSAERDHAVFDRTYGAPRWEGGPLAGRRLLVCAEQGIGDCVQFARFLRELQARGAQVVFEVPPSVGRALAAALAPGVPVSLRGEPLPDYDAWCPLMSLPHLLGRTTDFAVPMPYLQLPPARVAFWKNRLAALPAGRRIGVCWAGNANHRNDPWRSCPPALFAALAAVPDAVFVCLQKERQDEGVPALPGWTDWTASLDDYVETAALVAGLDLVITVDTALAHVAGALGVPAWVLVSKAPDWRWQCERDDSPWYPSLRLFRQRHHGDWEDVLSRIAAELGGAAADARPPAVAAPHSDCYQLLEARHGRFLVNRNDRYVGRSLLQYGEFSPAELDMLLSLVVPGGLVVEAGANLGAFTVPLARRLGERGRLVAFEPQRLVFQLLCTNLALNEIFNVDARQVALGAACGETTMPEVNPGVIENYGGLSAGRGGQAVPLLTLDALQLPRLDLLKADVEGMEREVLAGARQTIARCRPLLYLENDRREQSAALIGDLHALDYRLWWHLPPLFAPENYFACPDNVFGTTVSLNLLAVPRERDFRCALSPVRDPGEWPLA